jgi:NhaP-type Na+/H+ and K+/H+ antiporter
LQELLSNKDKNNLYANLSLAKSILNENIHENLIKKVDTLKKIVDNIKNMSIHKLNDNIHNNNKHNNIKTNIKKVKLMSKFLHKHNIM